MKTDIKSLQDQVKISHEQFEDSREEHRQVLDMYHNRQYTDDDLRILQNRSQPAETYNIVKLFGRLLVGYYSTVVNTVSVKPRQDSDMIVSQVLHDVVQFTFEDNLFETEGDKIKLDGILSGLMCAYIDVIDTGRTDEFGRPIRRVEIMHVPTQELLIDPMSRKEDYSDARFIHRFKWVSEETIKKILEFEKKPKTILDDLNEYENHIEFPDAEFEMFFEDHFIGYNRQYNNYLLIHSVVEDDDGKVWSVLWCGEEELSRKEITYRKVKFPYCLQRINTSDRAEYYGMFRELVESQKAINQALLKIQLMANTQKAFVENQAIEDLDEFANAFNRVSGIIPVKKLAGIRIENLSQQVLEQYALIDKAFDRIQRVLGINDSFLGHAFASDSGRKVKLQQNATTLALRYLTTKIEQMYRQVGKDILFLVQQYYSAHETLRITDNAAGDRWIEINKPIVLLTGRTNQDGTPEVTIPYEEVLEPASGEPMVDIDGNYMVAPIPTKETEIAFSEVDLIVDSIAYNDEDEKSQLMLETVLQGPIGQAMMQINPANYLRIAALQIRTVRTKHSPQIAEIINATAEQIQPEQATQMQDQVGFSYPPAMGSHPRSQELKLPQNTNEQ